MSIHQAHLLFKHDLDGDGCADYYQYHPAISMDDIQLVNKHPVWKAKRDSDFRLIKPFITNLNIWLYLSNDPDIGAEITKGAKQFGVNRKAITRPLNRFLSRGCVINALLPIAYEKVGKTKRVYTLKPGPKKRKSGLPTLSETRVRDSDDLLLIKKLALTHAVDKLDGAFSVSYLHKIFLRKYSAEPGYKTINGQDVPYLFLSEKNSLNYEQVLRLFNEIFTEDEKEIVRKGRAAYERSRRDKTGSSRQGVFRAGQLCEIDTTPLPLYVAFPFNRKKRESAGKVYLCLVVCVATHYVVGYSLCFTPPIWENVAEAVYNCAQDKQAYARKHGIEIESYEWSSQNFPESIRIDNGAENKVDILKHLVASQVFQSVHICGPDEPARKGTVENILAIIQSFLQRAPGTVVKKADKTRQHASQRAILQLSDIHRLIIKAIGIHNSTAIRPNLLNVEMACDEIDFVPSSMWQYSMNHPLEGRPKMSQKQLPEIIWPLLRKHAAKVRPNHIYFEKRKYWSHWAEEQGWFKQAANIGEFPIEVTMFEGDASRLYYKDDKGRFQQFTLKEDSKQFIGMTQVQALERQEQIDARSHSLKWERYEAEVNFHWLLEDSIYNGEVFFQGVPVNEAKSIQTVIDDNNAVMREQEQRARAAEYSNLLMSFNGYQDNNSSENLNVNINSYHNDEEIS